MNRKNELSDKKHAATDGEEKEKGESATGISRMLVFFFLSWVMMQDSSSSFFLLFLFLLPFLLVLAEAAT